MSEITNLTEQLRPLPKVSLHDHLDGSLRLETLIELSEQSGHELPATDPAQLAEIFRKNSESGSLERYLEVFSHTTAVMQTAQNLQRIAAEYVEDLAADGIVYAEVRWAPEQHIADGLSMEEAVEAVQAGLDLGVERLAAENKVMVVGQLLSAMRHSDRADEIVRLCAQYRSAGVVGFDIAGPEDGFSPTRFADSFTSLAAELIPATVHAGEAAGLDSIKDALIAGRAQRLGHGIRIAEDISVAGTNSVAGPHAEGTVADDAEEKTIDVELGDLATWIRDRQIHLETSPTSNLQTGAVSAITGEKDATMGDHPVDMLYQLGFNVGINTDNRLVSGVTLSGELAAVADAFGYSFAELVDFQINALESSFLGFDEREALSAHILEAWQV